MLNALVLLKNYHLQVDVRPLQLAYPLLCILQLLLFLQLLLRQLQLQLADLLLLLPHSALHLFPLLIPSAYLLPTFRVELRRGFPLVLLPLALLLLFILHRLLSKRSLSKCIRWPHIIEIAERIAHLG